MSVRTTLYTKYEFHDRRVPSPPELKREIKSRRRSSQQPVENISVNHAENISVKLHVLPVCNVLSKNQWRNVHAPTGSAKKKMRSMFGMKEAEEGESIGDTRRQTNAGKKETKMKRNPVR